MIVDTYHVLNGTDQKVFDRARAELEKDYTSSNAHEFYYDYKDKPLSFILRNSRNIFSEGYYGYNFYYELLSTRLMNPLTYESEYQKVSDYIEKAKAMKVPENQIKMYEALLRLIESKIAENKNLITVFKRAIGYGDGVSDYFTKFFDLLNDTVPLASIPSIADDIFHVDHDPFITIPCGYFFCIKYPAYTGKLLMYTMPGSSSGLSKFTDDYDDPDYTRKVIRINECIHEMMEDNDVVDNIKDMKNMNLLTIWTKCAKESLNTNIGIEDRVANVLESGNDLFLDSDVMAQTNPFAAVSMVTESVELQNESLVSKYQSTLRLKNVLEAYTEMAVEDINLGLRESDDPVYEQYDQALDTVSNDLIFMEWEDDGTANAVIKTQIMTSDERKKEEMEKKKAESSDPTDLTEEDALSEIKEAETKIKALQKKDGMTEEKFETEADKIKVPLSQLLHKACQDYPEVAAALNNLDMISFEESYNEDGDSAKPIDAVKPSHVNAPSDADPNAKHPKKPKVGMIRRIQNKALDTDAKLRKKEAETGEKVDELKAAGKAISYHPKMVEDKVDQTIANFDKWDDNRRKKFLLKPGFRHKIFRKFKVVLEYGIASKLKLSFVPVLWCIRHLSKQKDKRIRNELALELDNEIKICEEKISDASAKGDNQRKYELMRIKDKLDAERTRVRLNSKYV